MSPLLLSPKGDQTLMTFTQMVEQQKIKIRQENIQEVQNNIHASWVQDKINNYLNRFPDVALKEEIEEQIKSNPIIASFFCKDPAKQNISEKLAEKLLNTTKLPASGKSCIRFDNEGNIVSNAAGNTKSADFFINGYYATQKYTTEEGGAQDNQRNDVIDFLNRGSKKHKVMAILDGAYWEKYRPKLFQLFQNNPNVIITSIDEIKGDCANG